MLKVKGKTKIVKIEEFNGTLEIDSLLIRNDDQSVFRLQNSVNGFYTIKDSFGVYSKVLEKDFFKDFSCVLLISEHIYIPHGEILFKIGGNYTISSPLDFIGDGIEEAHPVFSLPHQIAKKENSDDFSLQEIQEIIFSETLDLAVTKNTIDDGLETIEPILVNNKVLILN